MAAHAPERASHFESIARQAHAARLGMWVFLSSEVLLFAALVSLYASYRVHYPAQFADAIGHSERTLGSVNTGILLVSSTLVALGVHALRGARRFTAAALVSGAIALGAVFLVLKLTEYRHHFDSGIYPGGVGTYFSEHTLRGYSEFWTLYFTMTGLHALHVMIGMSLLGVMAVGVVLGRITSTTSHKLEVAAIYWHLVDMVWIFLWPLFYLA